MSFVLSEGKRERTINVSNVAPEGFTGGVRGRFRISN